jgi:hypothetical protein
MPERAPRSRSASWAEPASSSLNAQDIKGGGVGVLGTGAKTVLGTVGTSAVTVTGTYAETGGASTTGGPWLVYIDYTV